MHARDERLIHEAIRRGVRSFPRVPEPRDWYRTDERSQARVRWLVGVATAPARGEKQAPLCDALALPVALASLILPHYAPVTPDYRTALYHEAVAQAPCDVAQMTVLLNQSQEVRFDCFVKMIDYRVAFDRALHSLACSLGKDGLPESLSFAPRFAA